MKNLPVLFCLMLFFAGCSPKEEEQEPDYENMVMADDDEEWSTGDRKNIAGDLPDPQELIILETPDGRSVPAEALR
jgi:hypothetical protein